MTKIIEIDDCKKCPHNDVDTEYGYCKLEKSILESNGIQNWCPLEDRHIHKHWQTQ